MAQSMEQRASDLLAVVEAGVAQQAGGNMTAPQTVALAQAYATVAQVYALNAVAQAIDNLRNEVAGLAHLL